MYSTENAQQVAKQLNTLQSSDLRFEKFNVQFLGNDSFEYKVIEKAVAGSIDEDFIHDCKYIKMPLNYRRVLNYIANNHKYHNNKLRKLTIKTIAQELHLCEKTVSKAIHFLIDNHLIVVDKKTYRFNFIIKDNVDYIYISDIWKRLSSTKIIKDEDGKDEKVSVPIPVTPLQELILNIFSRHYSHAKEGDYFESSQRRLATYLNYSASAVGNALRDLESKGLMRRVFFKDGQGYDTLGVNNDWLTSYTIADRAVDLAKEIQDKAANRTSSKRNNKREVKVTKSRPIVNLVTIYSPKSVDIDRCAETYINRVKQDCENDFEYQEIIKEKARIFNAYFNKREINDFEYRTKSKDIQQKLYAYLNAKGYYEKALDFQYQYKRAKRYLILTQIHKGNINKKIKTSR